MPSNTSVQYILSIQAKYVICIKYKQYIVYVMQASNAAVSVWTNTRCGIFLIADYSTVKHLLIVLSAPAK